MKNTPVPVDDAARRRARDAALRKRNSDGVTRVARTRPCRRCDALTFVGLDDDVCAVAVSVDRYPLDAAGEVQALLSHRRTYALHWYPGRGRYEIERRDALQIAAHPPMSVANVDVVVEHVCGSFALPTARTRIERAGTRKPLTDEPPF